LVKGNGVRDTDVEFTIKKIHMNDLDYFCLIIREIQCLITEEVINSDDIYGINRNLNDMADRGKDINPAGLSGLWPKFG